MACAGTLKRHIEFDPLMPQGSPKRMCLRPSTPSSLQPLNRGFKASPEFMAPSYRKNHLSPLSSSTSKLLGSSARRSLITIGTHSHLNLSDLLTSLKKDSKAESSGEHKETSGEQVDVSPKNTDTPTISIKMMEYIRSRVLQEFEEDVKEHFDRLLAHKLTEQYESFLRFNHNQLTSKFYASCASYVS